MGICWCSGKLALVKPESLGLCSVNFKFETKKYGIYGQGLNHIKHLRLLELSHDKLNKFLNGFEALHNGE